MEICWSKSRANDFLHFVYSLPGMAVSRNERSHYCFFGVIGHRVFLSPRKPINLER